MHKNFPLYLIKRDKATDERKTQEKSWVNIYQVTKKRLHIKHEITNGVTLEQRVRGVSGTKTDKNTESVPIR